MGCNEDIVHSVSPELSMSDEPPVPEYYFVGEFLLFENCSSNFVVIT